MSLQGSLDAFPLPDVLALLASTAKSGELRVRQDGLEGRVWLDHGLVTDVEGPDQPPTSPVPSAMASLFELLRLEEGEFTFTPGSAPAHPGQPVAVDSLLVEAEARLAEWRTIAAVVPSRDVRVRLAPRAPGEKVTMTAVQWEVLAAAGRGGSVGSVAEALGIDEFEACRAVKELCDAGLVEVRATAPAPAGPGPTSRRRGRLATPARVAVPAGAGLPVENAAALVQELAELGTDPAQAAEAVKAASRAATEEDRVAALENVLPSESDDPINRGLLLKFLSSVRS